MRRRGTQTRTNNLRPQHNCPRGRHDGTHLPHARRQASCSTTARRHASCSTTARQSGARMARGRSDPGGWNVRVRACSWCFWSPHLATRCPNRCSPARSAHSSVRSESRTSRGARLHRMRCPGSEARGGALRDPKGITRGRADFATAATRPGDSRSANWTLRQASA